ncbi:maleylpyruvate isomerase family mycothiol-dependent enzyme [Rhodococcus sp. TAF43]|uniref:maleylpyruvate isomerase family mycothiol-dependent enzyme n=1 Tax=Rhodococcus sp. TAF43 TaxID=3237483 RepID=UPI003F9E16BF
MAFNDLDLSERLDLAREGTAYFAQRLAAVSDADLSGPSLLEGWTRKHLVAHVGYNAAALCRILDWAATGVETPMYESMQQRAREIDEGATLSVGSLRNLFTHTAARLDEQWRTVPREAWAAQVRTAQGRMVPASETAWMRSREVWIHTVDLGNGGRFDEFPDVVLDSLLDDVVGMYGAVVDSARRWNVPGDDAVDEASRSRSSDRTPARSAIRSSTGTWVADPASPAARPRVR